MEKREVTIPTCISISISEDKEYLIIRDLNGKQYICPIESPEKIGKKVLELTNNSSLPAFDVAKLNVTNEGTSQEPKQSQNLGGIKFEDLASGGDMQSKLIQAGLGFLSGMNNYPRGNTSRR